MKSYYQAWIFLSLGATGAIYFLNKTVKRGIFLTLFWSSFMILLFLSLVASVMSVVSKSSERRLVTHATLDSFYYYQEWNPQEYEALIWVAENLPQDAVILEESDGDYLLNGRVATLTGRSTIMANSFHEYCWRGTWEAIDKRKEDLEVIFTSNNQLLKLNLLKKYHAGYIFLGTKEKEKYSPEELFLLSTLGNPVFQNKEVTIIQLP